MVMDEHHSEALGFVCRWSLLGLGCAAVLGAAYMGLSAAASTGGAQRVTVVLSDGITRPSEPTWVVCLADPPPRNYQGNLMMGGVRGKPKSFVGFWSGMFHLRPTAAVRLSRMTACGVPYRHLSYARGRGRLLVVSPARKVFFVEASLAERALSDRPEAWARFLELLRRRGEVAFVHPGPAARYEAFRSRLRAGGLEEPVISRLAGPNGSVRVLRGIARNMGGSGAADMMVLTDSPAVARDAAVRGFVSHLVGENAGVKPHRNLRRHDSLQNLIEHFVLNP